MCNELSQERVNRLNELRARIGEKAFEELFGRKNEERVVLEPAVHVPGNRCIRRHRTHASSVDGYVAKYVKCPNFDRDFKQIFDTVKYLLMPRNGSSCAHYKLVPVNSSAELQVGDVYLIGVNYHIVVDCNYSDTYKTAHNAKGQTRLRVVLESGRESHLFDSSFKHKFSLEKSYKVVANTPVGEFMRNLEIEVIRHLRNVSKR